MMTHRFFKSSREVYDSARLELDMAFGHPNERAETCMQPVPSVVAEGWVYVALPVAMSEWPEVASLIAHLIGEALVEEIDEATYQAAASQFNGQPE